MRVCQPPKAFLGPPLLLFVSTIFNKFKIFLIADKLSGGLKRIHFHIQHAVFIIPAKRRVIGPLPQSNCVRETSFHVLPGDVP